MGTVAQNVKAVRVEAPLDKKVCGVLTAAPNKEGFDGLHLYTKTHIDGEREALQPLI
jgi:hypothetical protein